MTGLARHPALRSRIDTEVLLAFLARRVRALAVFLGLFGLFTIFAICLASGGWKEVAAIGGAVSGLAVLSRGVYSVAVVWIIGMPTLFVFPDRYLNAIPGLNSGRILFLALVAMLALSRIFRLGEGRPPNRIEFFAGAFLALAFVSMVVQLPNETFAGVKVNIALFLQGYLMPLGAFFIARRIDWTPARLDRLLDAFVGAGLFLGFVAIGQQYFGVTAFDPRHIEVINADRAYGTLGHSHEFGAVVTSIMLIALFKAFHGQPTPGRSAGYLLAAAFMAFVLVLTKTRGPWLAALAAFAFVFVLDRRVRPPFVAAGVAVVLASIAVVPLLLESDLWRYRLAEVSPIYNRLTAYATSLNALAHHPFFGMGFTDLAFERAKAGYISDAGPISAYWVTNVGVPHNEFLYIALLTGLPGLGLYLVALAHMHAALTRIRRRASEPVARMFALYANAVILVYAVNAMLIDFGLLNYFTTMLYFLVGTAYAYGSERLPVPGEERKAGPSVRADRS